MELTDFGVVLVQYFLPSGYWYCVISYGGGVVCNCSGQVISPHISFLTCVPTYPVEGNRK